MKKMILPAILVSMTVICAQNGVAQEQTVMMHVSGMTCATCPISIRHRALQLTGVHTAMVNLDTASATVTYEDSKQSAQEIAQAITKLGYPASIAGTK